MTKRSHELLTFGGSVINRTTMLRNRWSNWTGISGRTAVRIVMQRCECFSCGFGVQRAANNGTACDPRWEVPARMVRARGPWNASVATGLIRDYRLPYGCTSCYRLIQTSISLLRWETCFPAEKVKILIEIKIKTEPLVFLLINFIRWAISQRKVSQSPRSEQFFFWWPCSFSRSVIEIVINFFTMAMADHLRSKENAHMKYRGRIRGGILLLTGDCQRPQRGNSLQSSLPTESNFGGKTEFPFP